MRARGLMLLTAILALLAPGTSGEAQVVESVRIVAPALLTFNVPNVNVVTYASGGTFRVSFDQAVLRSGRVVRISVKSEGDLIAPGGPSIQAGNLSWTTAGALNGVGINGTLSKAQYRAVFEGVTGVTSGHVDLTWSLDLGNRNVRAGIHTGQLRWRIETIIP